ncbi:hypothetical protein [Pontibacter arcticus]|uniref:Uncharacterized protein n=1 Tax=Pontibacter arcticus TaxID=2080288 RepID=A0A364RFM3_9BACT|nr:hypothetical protein [Pontibacter arcticus]RAU83140.1 hypothetical protein DP923_07895 [Pontibacter arcticus]
MAQDVILKKTGESIQSKVLEITPSEVKYKRFDNQEGPLYTVAKSDITIITYADKTTEAFETQEVAVSVPPSVPAAATGANNYFNMMAKGGADARLHYKGYTGAGTGTLAVSLLSPLIGLVPAVICSSTEPQTSNLNIPSPELFNDPAYLTSYANEAKKIKSRKVWKNWGIALGVNLALVIALAN